MNRFVFFGRLTADPEIRYGQKDGEQIPVATMNIAVDRRLSKQDTKTDFFRLTGFQKKAEFAERYLHKGSKILVDGRIQNHNYEKDGKKIYDIQFVIENIEFGDSKKEEKAEETKPDDFLKITDGEQEELPFNFN